MDKTWPLPALLLAISEGQLPVRFEYLKGSRRGSYAGEPFGKWRLALRSQGGDSHDVEVVDEPSTQERTMDLHAVNGSVPAEQPDNLLDQLCFEVKTICHGATYGI